jgi:Lipase (class 3)
MDIATCGLPYRRLEAFSFASPRVGSAKWMRHYDKQDTDTWRVANQRDVVTKLPLAWLGYRHVGTPRLFSSPKGIPPHSLQEAYRPTLKKKMRNKYELRIGSANSNEEKYFLQRNARKGTEEEGLCKMGTAEHIHHREHRDRAARCFLRTHGPFIQDRSFSRVSRYS